MVLYEGHLLIEVPCDVHLGTLYFMSKKDVVFESVHTKCPRIHDGLELPTICHTMPPS